MELRVKIAAEMPHSAKREGTLWERQPLVKRRLSIRLKEPVAAPFNLLNDLGM